MSSPLSSPPSAGAPLSENVRLTNQDSTLIRTGHSIQKAKKCLDGFLKIFRKVASTIHPPKSSIQSPTKGNEIKNNYSHIPNNENDEEIIRKISDSTYVIYGKPYTIGNKIPKINDNNHPFINKSKINSNSNHEFHKNEINNKLTEIKKEIQIQIEELKNKDILLTTETGTPTSDQNFTEDSPEFSHLEKIKFYENCYEILNIVEKNKYFIFPLNYQEYNQKTSQHDKYGIPFPPQLKPRIHLNPHLSRSECLKILKDIDLKFNKIENKGIKISKNASEIEDFILKGRKVMEKNINQVLSYNFCENFFGESNEELIEGSVLELKNKQ